MGEVCQYKKLGCKKSFEQELIKENLCTINYETEKCGPYIAYRLLSEHYKIIEKFDEVFPIKKEITIKTIPGLACPPEICENLVGLRTVVRHTDYYHQDTKSGENTVFLIDMILGSLSSGKFETADWIMKEYSNNNYNGDLSHMFESLNFFGYRKIFRDDEVSSTKCNTDSLNYYCQNIDNTERERIGRIRSMVCNLNTFLGDINID